MFLYHPFYDGEEKHVAVTDYGASIGKMDEYNFIRE